MFRKVFKNIGKLNWKWAAGELFLVVAGILIAFWIDAWWDDYKEKEDELKALSGLKDEFLHNRDQLLVKIGEHERVVDASRELLTMTGPDVEEINEPKADSLLWELAQSHTLNPELGELNAILNSGQIQHVENKELQIELAAWTGRLDDLAEEEQRGVRQVWDVLVPYLNPRIPMRNLLQQSELGKGVGRSLHDPNYIELFRERHFESLIENRLLSTLVTLEEERPLVTHIDSVVSMIDKSLKK